MEETNVRLLTRISDYLRARVWLQDYTIARKGFGGAQKGLMDTDDHAGHEIFCSLMKGSISAMDKFTS